MGIFDKFAGKKNKKENKEVFKQDLSEEARPGAVFMMQLLFEEPCTLPEKDTVNSVMQKYFGEVDNFAYDEKLAAFAIKKYTAHFKDGNIPPQLMIMGGSEFDPSVIGKIERSQMWNCPESDELLERCRYQICAADMMAAALHYKERAELDMDFMEALMEIFPQCCAVYFQNSGKLFSAEAIRNHTVARDNRFIHFAVNVRFFNIQGTEDMMVDSLGMSVLWMPDLQYHFHAMDPNPVVNHAYNLLSYMFGNENPLKSGDTVDGIVNGEMSRDVMWKCEYESSLIQPSREVIDIFMNEYASGKR